MPDTSLLVVIGLAFLLAGLVKGTIGMGLPTVAIGVLSLSMAPAQAAALYILPSIVTNIWQAFAGPSLLPLLRRLGTLLAGVAIGIFAGAGLLTGDDTGRAAVWLGVALAVYAVVGLVAVEFKVPSRWEPWLSPLVGLVTGLVTGATGVFVIPAVPYLQALDMDREELIQSLGLAFLTATVALAAALAQAGIFDSALAGISALAILPAAVGMYLGQFLRGRVSPKVFRTGFFVGMLGLGLSLASRAFR